MNSFTVFDYFLFGALTGAVLLALLGGCWALAYRGRTRWSAERQSDSSQVGHVPPRPIPHSFEAMVSGWLAFSDTTRRAYGSFEKYAQHLNDDPSRSLANPIPQPTPFRRH